MRNTENPNEVILLFSVEDPDKAKAFAASDDLRQAMQKAGVSDKPDVYFLEYSRIHMESRGLEQVSPKARQYIRRK